MVPTPTGGVVADFGTSLLVDATKRLLAHYRPDELSQWAKWCAEEIHPRRREIVGRFAG